MTTTRIARWAAAAAAAAAGVLALTMDGGAEARTAASAAAPRAGATFSGLTKQRLGLSFRVTGNRRGVRDMRLSARLKCRSGSRRETLRASVTVPVRTGRFTLRSGSYLYVTGRFETPSRASGELRVRLPQPDRSVCTSGTVRWTARAR